MTNIVHVIMLRDAVDKYRLDVPECYKTIMSAMELQKVYNGCGPDWLPERFRNLLTEIFEIFEPAFLVHDIEFNFGDKSMRGFDVANRRLYANCQALIAQKLSWLENPLIKARRYWQAWLIYRACQDFGWKAWLE